MRAYLDENFLAELNDNKDIIQSVLTLCQDVFGPYETGTVWQQLEDHHTDWPVLDSGSFVYSIEDDYRLFLLSLIDYNLLSILYDAMATFSEKVVIAEMKETSEEERLVVQQTAGVDSLIDEIVELGFSRANIEKLLPPKMALPLDKLADLNTAIADVTLLISKLEPAINISAVMQLHETPIGTPANFEKFLKLVKNFDENSLLEDMAPILRYMSQAVFGSDSELTLWAYQYFGDRRLDRRFFLDAKDNLFHCAITYILMKNFPLFNTEQQNLVAEFYIWPAIFWGFPIEFIFSKTLADEIDVGYYGLRSSGFADIMALSDQYIVFGDKGPTTVGDFIRKFLSFNVGETEIDKSFQFEYVRTFVAEHILPDEYIVHLQRLLALFVNLRECDLFDYRGYLSDIDLMPMMDWELYFENEVNYKRVEEIKNYFTLVRRPLFHKIRIINAVENHEWREEKFLEKLIDLSDIFESAYDGMYGRLVYFDEIANQFELDKTLTDMVARLESMGKK